MYIPTHFEITDADEIYSFIEANAFGQLISTVEGRLYSTHIPFLLSPGHKQLLGHLAKENPQWKDIDGQEVLITLQGPHAYISPSWYSSPGVPTWNYQAVHVYGTCHAFNDASRLKQLVESLTAKYESTFDQPWQPDYQASMLKAIVGIEIEISELQCKYKLSQNRSSQDRSRVTKALGARGSNQVEKAMRELK
ncbi:MAG: FMN-binding negative transcriptional regulator [Proteobacteria bacterium]|nr:FMN-binding negative transcriptional regulator [Pseudomonadota bacterium]